MDSQWQTSHAPITADEADKLVGLVLRQRLTGGHLPVEEQTLTVGSLAQAMGAREDEVAALLGDLRSRKGSSKPKRAIPIPRSIAIIVAIYSCAAMGLYMLGRRHATTSYIGYAPPEVAYSAGDFDMGDSSYVTRGIRSHLPPGFGFRFRGFGHRGGRLLGQSVDWASAEKYYVDLINKVGSSTPVSLKPNVTVEEIASELALGDSFSDRSPSSVYEENSPIADGRFVRWDPIEITADGHSITTVIPSAKVADEDLEKAVRNDVKQRIAKVMKLMRIRMDASEPTELR